MNNLQPGFYDDGTGTGTKRWWDGNAWTEQTQTQQPAGGLTGFIDQARADAVAGAQPRQAVAGASYVVLQVSLKEKFWGTGSNNLTELEHAINSQAALGYRLHTISTSTSGSTGFGGGDRIQATMVFEKLS